MNESKYFENTELLFEKIAKEFPGSEPSLRRLINRVLIDVRNANNSMMVEIEHDISNLCGTDPTT